MIRILLICVIATWVQAQHMDPELTVGPDQCGECHKNELAVWKETKHHKSFFDITRSEEGRQIAQKMGIKRIKRESDCLNCHFTSIPENDAIVPVAGISCESCHGPAKNWIDVHNDYGGKDMKKEDESPDHRVKRLADAIAGGMLRPDNLYLVAENCFQCHTVPNERLVNEGGHTAGSAFELVSWSQGEIRHNFLRSDTGDQNMEASANRKRMMFILGQVLDLEYSLRGTALATAKAEYAVSMAKRSKLAGLRLKKIQETQPVAQVQKIIELADSVELKLNNADALNRLADQISELGQELARSYDGSAFSALDALLPDPSTYKGSPAL